MEENLRVHYGDRSREDDIRDALHKLDEKGTAARKPGPKRRRKRGGEFIVRGPDWLWCIDGHDKFRNYGIGIYAAVDAIFPPHRVRDSIYPRSRQECLESSS